MFFFFKAFSWENDLHIILGELALKKCKTVKRNLYLTKNRFGGNEICYAEENHSYMSNMCANEFSGLNFNSWVIGKPSIIQEITPNYTY